MREMVKDRQMDRLEQPIGQQYRYGKGPFEEELRELEQLKRKVGKEKGIIMSMPHKGTPADNAISEPFKNTSTTIILFECWQS